MLSAAKVNLYYIHVHVDFLVCINTNICKPKCAYNILFSFIFGKASYSAKLTLPTLFRNLGEAAVTSPLSVPGLVWATTGGGFDATTGSARESFPAPAIGDDPVTHTRKGAENSGSGDVFSGAKERLLLYVFFAFTGAPPLDLSPTPSEERGLAPGGFGCKCLEFC